jgi:NADH:ubiquinone reductase (non-electrogenic)
MRISWLVTLACVAGIVECFVVVPAPIVSFKTKTTNNNIALYAAPESCDVAIFGGGFGGLYSALAIAREARQSGQKLDVVLVEPTENFVFLPLLYDLTVGTASEGEVCPTYKDILEGTGVRHVRASLDSLTCASSDSMFSQANINLLVTGLVPATSTGTDDEKKTLETTSSSSSISFRAAVVAVGASPDSILKSVPGAVEYAQPFYTAKDAHRTRRLLQTLESQVRKGKTPQVAVVGGGYAGVELAASVKRKVPQAGVTLLARGAPMAGTRAEKLIDKALQRLGVEVEICSVQSITAVVEKDSDSAAAGPKLLVKRSTSSGEETQDQTQRWFEFDAVLWTAGSAPAYPVSKEMKGLSKSGSGRLAIDSSLRCNWEQSKSGEETNSDSGEKQKLNGKPNVWALGDCSEIISASKSNGQPAVPRTAQAAMQQAETVAYNVLAQLDANAKGKTERSFQFQDLGSMLTLGGPNAAVLAPTDGSFAPIFEPLLTAFGGIFDLADDILSKSTVAEKIGLTSAVQDLGLSLGGYGLGVDAGAAPGTLAGTLTGAARRAVYAARMPTNNQRAVAATSAAIYGAAALAKEASDRNKQ